MFPHDSVRRAESPNELLAFAILHSLSDPIIFAKCPLFTLVSEWNAEGNFGKETCTKVTLHRWQGFFFLFKLPLRLPRLCDLATTMATSSTTHSIYGELPFFLSSIAFMVFSSLIGSAIQWLGFPFSIMCSALSWIWSRNNHQILVWCLPYAIWESGRIAKL